MIEYNDPLYLKLRRLMLQDWAVMIEMTTACE